TDSRPKQAVFEGSGGWRVGGFAKGAGMIAPAMATMLAVLSTDADVSREDLDAALRAATAGTFDLLDIDGSTSTNDTVLVLASGASGVPVSREGLTDGLTAVCTGLVDQLQADAEGVTKHVTVTVRGAATRAEAVAVARSVARDNLVKTAFFGSDPNWGRIAMAVGNAAEFDPQQLDITINGVAVCVRGGTGEDRSKADLSGKDITVAIDLHAGDGTATVLTTDLSHGYVEENSAYSS
ncbi:MAG: bifunctional ornithine acetyltransferase/N-acetylglutamate synthase, partial [Thermocrispum sp.]